MPDDVQGRSRFPCATLGEQSKALLSSSLNHFPLVGVEFPATLWA
jgi:hypothetical protein